MLGDYAIKFESKATSQVDSFNHFMGTNMSPYIPIMSKEPTISQPVASLEPGFQQKPKLDGETILRPNTNALTNGKDENRASYSSGTKTSIGRSKSSKPSPSSSNVDANESKSTTPNNATDLPSSLSFDNSLGQFEFQSDNDEWNKSFVLTLDGGGVRGYSSLLIIQELMKFIQEIETMDKPAGATSYDPLEIGPVLLKIKDSRSLTGFSSKDAFPAEFLPCHYFDLMAGTSTGGLIAIMLGRLRMSIDDAIKEFTSLAGQVFGKPRIFHIRSPLLWPRAKYDHATLEKVVQELTDTYTGRRPHNVRGKTFDSDPYVCRTMVVAYEKSSSDEPEQPFVFRSYDNDDYERKGDFNRGNEIQLKRNPGPAHSAQIYHIARATSAAPGYFDPVEIDNKMYCDGGFGCNNPTMEAYHEVISLKPSLGNDAFGLVLSIGTGNQYYGRFAKQSGFRGFYEQVKAALSHTADTYEVHRNMDLIRKRENIRYFRINVNNKHMGKIKLDQWKKERHGEPSTEKDIKRHTEEYLKQKAQQDTLRDVAKILVDNRRKRAKTERWSDFLAYRYRCHINPCDSQEVLRMKDFRQHLCETHSQKHPKDQNSQEHEVYERLVASCRIL